MSISPVCMIAFADKEVTRMTVWSPYGNDLDLGRALQLARYAYESRMRRPPPERDITIAGKIYRLPHILALCYQTVEGKTYDMGESELAKYLIFAMILGGQGTAEPPRS